MKNTGKNGGLSILSYISLVLLATLILIQKLLPVVGVDIQGVFINIMETVQLVLTLIVLFLLANDFVKGNTKLVRTIYIIAIVIFVAGIVLLWFR